MASRKNCPHRRHQRFIDAMDRHNGVATDIHIVGKQNPRYAGPAFKERKAAI